MAVQIDMIARPTVVLGAFALLCIRPARLHVSNHVPTIVTGHVM
jgi:hypothetical protein